MDSGKKLYGVEVPRLADAELVRRLPVNEARVAYN